MIGVENSFEKTSEMEGEFTFHSTNKDHLQDIKVHLVLQMIGVENQITLKKASEMVGEFTFHSTNKDYLQDIKVHLVVQIIGEPNSFEKSY